MLAPLDNEIVFKMAFQNQIVFKQFVKDILEIDFEGTIETEKQFYFKNSNIKFKLDIFAESTDKRVIIEIQRVSYDYHFDRFLGNFLSTITEQQTSSIDYKISRTVYSIIILTSAYKIDDKSGHPIIDEYLIQNLDPENILKERVPIFGHTQVYINPYYVNDRTPKKLKAWLEFINASIHNSEGYVIDNKNIGIQKAAEIIEFENFDSDTWHKIKIANETRDTLLVSENIKFNEGKAEGIKEGIKEGEQIAMQKGKIEGIMKALKRARLSVTEIAEDFEVSTELVLKIKAEQNL